MIPGIREIISIPAGISCMNLPKFVGYTFAGSLLWCVILTLVGYYLGEAWSNFSDQISSAFTIITLILIAAAIAVAGFWYSRRRRASAKKTITTMLLSLEDRVAPFVYAICFLLPAIQRTACHQ